jgi:hypothetical protein
LIIMEGVSAMVSLSRPSTPVFSSRLLSNISSDLPSTASHFLLPFQLFHT